MKHNAKRAEEQRRENCWDKPTCWKVLQETMTWGESQRLARHNTPTACRREETRKLQ